MEKKEMGEKNEQKRDRQRKEMDKNKRYQLNPIFFK